MKYKQYVVSILLVVYIFNFMDRQILSILIEPIKQELELSDTQMGLLSGIAFALFYTTLGIPIAWLADRKNRVNIISISVVIWSGLTALCGLANNFIQLFILRLGVGVGEAGCTPPAHSLISDYYDRNTRAKAVSIYMLGIPFGVMLGLLIGGYVNEYYGWRWTFMLVGLPGLLVALALKLTVKEPKRSYTPNLVDISLKETLLGLWKNASFRHIVLAHSLFAWVGYGVIQWFAAYIIRRFDMPTGELGLYSAIIYGSCVTFGTYAGGWLASRYSYIPRFQTNLCAIGLVFAYPLFVLVLHLDDPYWALWGMGPVYIFMYLCLSPTFALFQNLSQPQTRAMATAVAMLVINLIGMGLGPLSIGLVSDILQPEFSETEGLRLSMLLGLSVLLWSAFHYWWAGRTLQRDLSYAEKFES